MKKKEMKKRKLLIRVIIFLIIAVLLIVLSTELYKYFNKNYKNLEGELGESKISVTASMKNTPPVIDSWETPLDGGNPPIPNEGGERTVRFLVNVSDRNGFNDITDTGSSITAKFKNINNGPIASEQERATLANCIVSSTNPPRSATFECSINMQYWDESGLDKWTIEVSARDTKSGSDLKSSQTGNPNYPFFSYGSLLGMAVDKSSLSFQNLDIDTKNIASADNPVTIRNTGNVPITASGSSWIKITGYDLVGLDSLNIMSVSSFAVNEVNDCLNNFDNLVNNNPVSINGAVYSRRPGNDSSGLGKSELYFCIGNQINPYPLPTDDYSTQAGNEWSIGVTQ